MCIPHQEKESVYFYTVLLNQSMALEDGTDRISRNVGTFVVQSTLRKIPEEGRSQPESYLKMKFLRMHQENEVLNLYLFIFTFLVISCHPLFSTFYPPPPLPLSFLCNHFMCLLSTHQVSSTCARIITFVLSLVTYDVIQEAREQNNNNINNVTW